MSLERKKNELRLVQEFQDVFDRQQLTIDALIRQRISLISEEIREYKDAIEINDVLEELDALIDIKYVSYGALIRFNSTYYEPYFCGTDIGELEILLKGYAWDSDTKGMCNIFCEIIAWADNQLEIMFEKDPTSIYSAFADVHRNNMNKMHKSIEHAQQTIAKLGNAGYKIDAVGDKMWALIRLSDNKIIKPYDHEKVSLRNYILCLQ